MSDRRRGAVSGRVYTDGVEVVLCTGSTDGDHEWATAMAPSAAEEMAHALLPAAAARGHASLNGTRRWSRDGYSDDTCQ